MITIQTEDKLSEQELSIVNAFRQADTTILDIRLFKKKILLPFLNDYYVTKAIMSVVDRSQLTKAEVDNIKHDYNRKKLQLSTFYKFLK